MHIGCDDSESKYSFFKLGKCMFTHYEIRVSGVI